MDVYGVNGTQFARAPSTYGTPLNIFCKKKVVKAACQGGPPVRFMDFMGIIWVESSDIEDI